MKLHVILSGILLIVAIVLGAIFLGDGEMSRTADMVLLPLLVLNGAVCFLAAGKEGRNKLGWGLAGFLLPLFTNIAFLLVPPAGDEVQATSMVSFLHDKTVCLGCGTVHPDLRPGKICSECGSKVLGFYAGTTEQACDNCGASLSDSPASPDKRMGVVMQERGLRCSECNKLLCYSCSGVEDRKGEAACACGGNLEIRI